MRKITLFFTMLFCGLSLYAEFPVWLEPFRDAVFGQNISISAAESLFRDAEQQARRNLAGAALYAALSRCEYYMGRVYQDHGQNTEAAVRYEEGVSLAERSLDINANAEAYVMIASNIGQLCMIKSTGWVMSNGLKVEQNARRALQLDSRNAAAMYLIASRWAFGPGILGNPRRGINELQAILNSQAVMQISDYFDVYSALAYAHSRLNQNNEALSWIDRALVLYPTNKFALDLKSEIVQKLGTR